MPRASQENALPTALLMLLIRRMRAAREVIMLIVARLVTKRCILKQTLEPVPGFAGVLLR